MVSGEGSVLRGAFIACVPDALITASPGRMIHWKEHTQGEHNLTFRPITGAMPFRTSASWYFKHMDLWQLYQCSLVV